MQIHVMPILDEKEHIPHSSCWCFPIADIDVPAVIIHNAKDCREKIERQTASGCSAGWEVVKVIA